MAAEHFCAAKNGPDATIYFILGAFLVGVGVYFGVAVEDFFIVGICCFGVGHICIVWWWPGTWYGQAGDWCHNLDKGGSKQNHIFYQHYNSIIDFKGGKLLCRVFDAQI